MKRTLACLLTIVLLAISLALSACGENSGENHGGTYYPTNEEMKKNLEKKGYHVKIYEDVNYQEFFIAISAYYPGTLVEAKKGENYLYFYRADTSDYCEGMYCILEESCSNPSSLVKIENDEAFGNIVYCGTASAIDAAGIRVVKVTV